MRSNRDPLDSDRAEAALRTFVAIELPQTAKKVLLQTQDALRRHHGSTVRWVNPEGVHLTLEFLGSVSTSLLTDVEKALNQATSPFSPFRLTLASAGVFPNWRAPRVVWIGVDGDVRVLASLQQQVEKALLPLGFTSEARPFSPHLTLGRVRQEASPQERRALGEAVQAVALPSNPEFTVQSVSLMRSELRPSGAIYTCLASFLFRGQV